MLLFGAEVLALTHNRQAEDVPVERQAGLDIAHHDGGMIDAQKQAIRWLMPFRVALPSGKLQDLQRVTIGILEVKGSNAPGTGVPVRQALRPRRGVLDLVLAQPLVGSIHVADDKRDMLKPAVVTPRIQWDWSALGDEVFG